MPIRENLLQKKALDGRQIVYFNGAEAFLAGTYPHAGALPDIQKLDGVSGDAAKPDDVDFGPPLALLAKYTNNFFRHWVIFYANFVDGKPDAKGNLINIKPNCDEKVLSVTSQGVPWRERYSPFMYNRALDKWDLWRYNEDYFIKLRKMVKQAYDHGIIVQLTLFDHSGIITTGSDACLRWHYSPWNSTKNVNNIINNSTNGVSDFYNRSLVGQIRYRDRADREHWPNTGPPQIVVEDITLGELQDLYVEKVVRSTVEFPNVCYEIMNEPQGGPDDGVVPLRVKWANEIVGVIHRLTEGKRFIFYNDMTAGFGAADVAKWQGLSNYDKLDGVIFHGDLRDYNPDDRRHPLNAAIRRDKIIQVSSDIHTDPSYDYNFKAARNAFDRHMIFQSETNAETANQGIHDAMPTLLHLPPFVGRWWKLVEQSTPNYFPHLVHVVNADGTVVDLNQDTDQLTMTGRVVSILGNRLTSWNELSQNVATFSIEFPEPARMSPPVSIQNATLLQFTRDNIVQVFRRLDKVDPLYRFYFKWERISVTPADFPVPPFYMFIYPDRSLVTHNKADFVKNSQGKITGISSTQIDIFNNNKPSKWNYTFSHNDQQLTLVKVPLTTDDKPLTETFQRLL